MRNTIVSCTIPRRLNTALLVLGILEGLVIKCSLTTYLAWHPQHEVNKSPKFHRRSKFLQIENSQGKLLIHFRGVSKLLGICISNYILLYPAKVLLLKNCMGWSRSSYETEWMNDFMEKWYELLALKEKVQVYFDHSSKV